MSQATPSAAPVRQRKKVVLGDLYPGERDWRDRQPWLLEQGYQLRPRFQPTWVPSWLRTGERPLACEDGVTILPTWLVDATRISDQQVVFLKVISEREHPQEVEINNRLRSEPLASDPRNHSAQLIDVLKPENDSDISILVMPFLRRFDSPPFDTFGEAVAFFQQIFEGLSFMHEHHIAHRDCNGSNVMMDPSELFPDLYHPARIDRRRDLAGRARYFTRTEKPSRYYFVDFGISRQYLADDPHPLEDIIEGGDRSAPEHQDPNAFACNPFPTDVYYIGNLVREYFIKPNIGFDFMESLVADMTQVDPTLRPTMDQVVKSFDVLVASLTQWKLRSRIVAKNENFFIGVYKAFIHWVMRVSYILRCLPAIPMPLSP